MVEKIEIICAFCRGQGVRHAATCQVCKGAGKVALFQPTRPCAYCRGSGIQPRQNLTCSVCRGVGVVTVEADAVLCPPCGGTGVEPQVFGGSLLPCLTCAGKGVLSARRAKSLPPARHRPQRRAPHGGDSRKVTLEY